MVRHPHYLDVPWAVQWHGATTDRHRHWWLIALLTLAAIFMIGVGVTHGLL